MKPIVVSGSAANPPHLAHQKLIVMLLRSQRFFKVIWVPSGYRPDKQRDICSQHRLAMTMKNLSTLASNQHLIIDTGEIDSPFTPAIRYLDNLKQKYPKRKIYYGVGSDLVVKQAKHNNSCEIAACWYRGDELVDHYNFLIIPRVGFDLKQIDPALKNYKVFDCELPEISSSQIRSLAQADKDFSHLVDKKVFQYIKSKKLYN